MAENTIDNLSIEVTTSADEAARTFDRLASGMGRVRNAASGAAGAMRDTANAAEETANAGTQTGYAESHIRRFARALMTTSSQTIGRFITAVNRGASAVGGFIRQIGRILMYRSIRSLIKDLGQSFRDLYGWSRMFGTDFANSMDKINTSAVYLRNSFAAMVAPIINALAPAIDVIADKIVDIFNFVNQVFAALSGAETYTVAKKVAQSWESTFDSASRKAKKTAKEIRNTLLGFDEINRLNGNTPTSTGSTGSSPYTPGYNTMFEEKPLKGFFKQISDFTSKMPDWLKWLFGGAALVGGFLLIRKFIPWLLKKLGELFSLKIPNWLKWLFGPRSDKNKGINIPDKIDLPDGSIEVDLKKGDWSALDDVPRTLYMSPKLDNKPSVLFDKFQNDWNNIPGRTLYLSPKLDNTAKVLFATFIAAWAALGSKSLYFSPKLDNTAKTLYDDFKRDWDNSGSKSLYFSPKLDNDAYALFNGFRNNWNKIESRTLYMSPKLDNTAKSLYNSFKREWAALGAKILYLGIKLNNTAKVLLDNFKKDWNMADPVVDVEVNLKKKNWNTVTKYIDDSFGGATGGGGRTSGGGAGRDYGVSVSLHENQTSEESKNLWGIWWDIAKKTLKLEQDVVVKLVEGWYGTPESALGIDNLTVDATPKWKNYSNGIYGYLNIDDLSTTVKIKTQSAWDYFGKTIKQYLGLDDLSTTVKVKLKATGKGVELQQTTGGSGGGWKLVTRAAGGAIDRLGRVSNFANGGIINAYAGGTTNARGTMFLAGEAGPEIVGHIGGRTEVLNRSQLAATMYSAVRNAMSGITIDANFNNVNSGTPSTDSMETLVEMMRQAFDQVMARSNDYDRQKVDLLRQINEKDWDVDISTASINKAQTRTNRRAGTTIVPVGTT